MHETLPITERCPEHIPTAEEVAGVFEQLVKGKEYKETRKLEDENGLYLWDIEIPDESGEGIVEYSYRRGRPAEGQLLELRIDVAFYDSDGMPISGTSAAKFENGAWKIIS
ncbi:MAG: hypothetical protein WAP52_04155 [Candidatus Sungiibacteriota bacterium]